jgi:hypothetical protein
MNARVRPEALRCRDGSLVTCANSLWAALDAAGNELQAVQGADPSAWRADAGAERIEFAPGCRRRRFGTRAGRRGISR